MNVGIVCGDIYLDGGLSHQWNTTNSNNKWMHNRRRADRGAKAALVSRTKPVRQKHVTYYHTTTWSSTDIYSHSHISKYSVKKWEKCTYSSPVSGKTGVTICF